MPAILRIGAQFIQANLEVVVVMQLVVKDAALCARKWGLIGT